MHKARQGTVGWGADVQHLGATGLSLKGLSAHVHSRVVLHVRLHASRKTRG